MNRALFIISSVCLAMTVSCAHKKKAEESVITEVTEAKAAVEKPDGPTYTCQVGKDMRTIAVDKTAKRCEVFYTKFGEKSQVAWAEATPDICSRVYDQIKNNIQEKGFKCSEDTAALKTERKAASTE